MELKYFRLIKTIVEEGNIANSSERLFLTQSALSHQLKDLEGRLGFKVFLRARNNWTLTKEGEELYKLAIKLHEAIDAGFSNIEQIRSGSKGNIRVTTECQSFFHGLPAFVQKMAILYPDINIDLHLGANYKSISQILADEIDIAIVTRKPSSDLLSCIEIFDDEIYVIMHREHFLSDVEFVDASHFSDVHLIIHSFPLESVSVFEHFIKPNDITPKNISAIPYTEVTLEMIQANMGVACMPKWGLKSFTLSKELILKRIGKNGLKRTHYLAVKKENRHKKYMNDFITNFEEDFLGKPLYP